MSNIYPFKLWLLAIVIVAPLLLFIWSFVFKQNTFNTDDFKILIQFIPLALTFSIPTLFVCCFVFFGLSQTKLTNGQIKCWVAFTAITGATITLILLGGSRTLPVIILYSLSTIISSLLIRTKENVSIDLEKESV